MTRRLRLSLIGPGAIAEDHLAALRSDGGIDLCKAMGRRIEPTQVFAGRWGFRAATTDLAVLLDDDSDVVLICSPNGLHVEQARACLERGKQVILELPAALSYPEAQQLELLARERRREVHVCQTMRSFPAIEAMRAAVAAGDRPGQITGFFAIPRRSNQGHSGPRSWSDDLLWHHACHLVDAALWVLGGGSVSRASILRGPADPTTGMAMDLACSFLIDEVIVSLALTYHASSLDWQLASYGGRSDLRFVNGALLRDGDLVGRASGIRDLRTQDAAILASLREGTPSGYELATVLQAMAVLADLERLAA